MTKVKWNLFKVDYKLMCYKCGNPTFKKIQVKKPVCHNCQRIARMEYYINQSYAQKKDNGK